MTMEGCGIARKKREWYPHATYHLMERGIRRQPIFTDEMDYQVFQAIARDTFA
jgi:REP element-mobilizing transposase RayT